MMIEVRGSANDFSDGPTLSSLELADSFDNDPIRLNESFSPQTTLYTATVKHRVFQITVTPTTTSAGATVAYLDASAAALADANGLIAGHQVNLVTGDNTFKIKVTDGSETRTYTVTVTRRGAPLQPGNRPPEFREGDTATRRIHEHVGDETEPNPYDSQGQYRDIRFVGHGVSAFDPDDNQLFYSRRDNANDGFAVYRQSVTRQFGHITLRRGFNLDYETKSSHTLTMVVTDGSLSDTIEVTIEIIDVDEPPLAPAAPTATGDSPTSLSVSWAAPDSTGRPEVTGYDLRYRRSGRTDWLDGPQGVSSASATISGLHIERDYEVQVRAKNHEGDGEWSPSGVGRTTTPDSPTARFGESSYKPTEGGGVNVKVIMTPAASSRVTIPLVVTGQNGMTAADYTGVPPSVIFAPGVTEHTFTLGAVDDEYDAGEILQIALGDPPAGVVNADPKSATVTFREKPGSFTWYLWFTESSYTATEGGQSATVTLALNKPWQTGETLTLPLAKPSPGGGATEEDFTGIPSSISFAPGTTRTSFVVTAVEDSDDDYGHSVGIDFPSRFPDGWPADLSFGRGPKETRVRLVDNDGHPDVRVSFNKDTYRAVEGGQKRRGQGEAGPGAGPRGEGAADAQPPHLRHAEPRLSRGAQSRHIRCDRD